MSRYDEIISLFKTAFHFKEFRQRGEVDKFTCPNLPVCKVKIKREPIWSSGLGSEDTKVMIVAEAPSKKGGLGPHTTGLVENWPDEEVVQALLRFVKRYYNTVPYFADLMKCGVFAQTKQAKKIFDIRKTKCVEQFLLKEIYILKPETILCLGAVSYNELKNYKESGIISGDIELVKLIHYGNQANLQITSTDKENLIWPFQAKKIDKGRMSELSIFN